MTKRVQLLGHDAETANAFIGEERELTVDTDAWHLRLHDGATVGGRRILNRDENDNRYQARSVELDGLLGWEPNERGILARQGPSNYDLISIEVDPNNLTIDFPDAFGGNPFISLNPLIQSEHTFSGPQTFNGVVTGTAGFVGNLTGNTLGTHTGNVIGNVTGNLTGDAAGSHTGTFTGVGVFSAITVPDGSFELSSLTDAALETLNDAATFVGQITMYSGLAEDIPDNWALCDGTNGTPDLRNRFIVGAGDTYAEDATGGAATHSHTVTIDSGGAHSHTGTVGDTALTVAQLPVHKHANGVTDNVTTDVFSRGTVAAGSTTPNSIESNGADGVWEGYTSEVGSGDTHTHTLSTDVSGAHNHTGSTAASSSLPPYYALAFVKRIA